MVKIENRVAQTKISRFIETSPLVIFLNGKSTELGQEQIKNDLHKKLTKSLADAHKLSITLHKKSLNFNEKESSNLSTSEANDTLFNGEPYNKGLQIKFVKNNYVKKALHKKPLFYGESSTFALPQGNNLVIALQHITFFLLKDLKQNNKFSILGAIYKNCSIDHNQISQLSKVIEEDQIYYNLNNALRAYSSNLINLTNSALATRCANMAISNNIYAKLCFTLSCLQKKKQLVEESRE